ncbi:MAG: N-carbamoylputrescine amidase [Polyangiales bacterium]
MSVLRVAVVQLACGDDVDRNLGHAGELLAEAAARGAQIVLLPELFGSRYFPREKDPARFALAEPRERSRAVHAMRLLARMHEVVLPVSYFERDGDRCYNSVVMLDADGRELGSYRKSHIPDGPGYEEKFFFAPGDTGFRVWGTRYGRIGVGICWDQWFPECARAMALAGADLLLYPSAIGSEPLRPEVDTQAAWQRVMLGHAVANTVPLAASNRVGDESGQRFYGSSFVADGRGEVLARLDREQEGVAIAELDLDGWRDEREWMGLLRDRRPDLYASLVEGAGSLKGPAT